MTTLEDAMYDFEQYDINFILNKKKLGAKTPIPIKQKKPDCSRFELNPYIEETKMDEEPLESIEPEPASQKKYDISIFRKKYYIRPEQDCPICLEPILTKTSAFLTPCGHGFHKMCIHRAFETKWLTKQAGICCPICRYSDISDYCVEKYCCWNRDVNQLDGLENFWMSKDIMLGTPCFNGLHYIGFDKNCNYCKKYRIIKLKKIN